MKKRLFGTLVFAFAALLAAENVEIFHHKYSGWRDFFPADYRKKNFTKFEVKQQYGYVRWCFTPAKKLSYDNIAFPCQVNFIPKSVILPVRNNAQATHFFIKLEGADGKQFFSTGFDLPAAMKEQGLFTFNAKALGKIAAIKLPIKKVWVVLDRNLKAGEAYDVELSSIILVK